MKRIFSFALAATMTVSLLTPGMVTAYAEEPGYNDTIIDWGEHLTHEYDDCEDRSCNVCGALRTAPGHQYDHDCDVDCNVCGAVREVGDHVYDNACDADCNVCGEIREVGDHVYDNACDVDCNACGDKRAITHDYQAVVTPADCENGGYTTHTCSVCGDHYVDAESEAIGHDYEAVVTAPDCENDGYTTHTCSHCGNSYVDSETAALGHAYDNACDVDCNVCGDQRATTHDYEAAVTAPDCENGGYTTYTCSVCGDTYVADKTAALGHTAGAEADCENNQVCTVCGKLLVEATGHDYDAVVTEPTCENGGYTTHTCSACGDTYVDAQTEAIGHDYEAVVIEPDCVNGGYTTRTCSRCGDRYVDAETEATGHDYNAVVTEPGCENGGYTTHTCSVCGNSYVDAEIAATGHIYENDLDIDCDGCGTYRIVMIAPPETTYGKEGVTVTMPVGVMGDGLTYTWYIKNAGSSKYSKSSVTTNIYSTKISNASHGRSVYCVITDAHGNEMTTDTVLIRRQASITTDLATAAYAKKGAKVTVKVTAKGDGLTYTWYIKNSGASKYSKSSVTAASYSATMSSSVKNRSVYCIVKDKYGKTVQTKTAVLRESVSITKEPATTIYAKKNATAKVSVTASGDGLTYTWYVKNNGASKYTKSSTKTATYSVKMTAAVKGRRVYCIVKDKYGKTVQSKTVLLRESVSIVTQPKTVTVKKNATAKVTVKASGDGLTYTWYYKNASAKKFTKVSGSKTYYSVKMTSAVKNRKVYCVVKDKYGKTVQTSTVTLKMK